MVCICLFAKIIGKVMDGFQLVFSIYQFYWNRVGSDFNGQIPGYSQR